jgi:ribosomal protein L37AE/L43A
MRRALEISGLEHLPCPLCGECLERGQGRQGLVWICRSCCAGAVTLPILRRVAPRPFVNQLWQAALHQGCRSSLVCPACTQPFTEIVSAAFPQILVCVRCYWVWLGSDVLASLSTPAPQLPPPRAQRWRAVRPPLLS